MGPTALDTLNPLPDTQIMESGADYLVRFEQLACQTQSANVFNNIVCLYTVYFHYTTRL